MLFLVWVIYMQPCVLQKHQSATEHRAFAKGPEIGRSFTYFWEKLLRQDRRVLFLYARL